jgi:hypothetical protein
VINASTQLTKGRDSLLCQRHQHPVNANGPFKRIRVLYFYQVVFEFASSTRISNRNMFISLREVCQQTCFCLHPLCYLKSLNGSRSCRNVASCNSNEMRGGGGGGIEVSCRDAVCSCIGQERHSFVRFSEGLVSPEKHNTNGN